MIGLLADVFRRLRGLPTAAEEQSSDAAFREQMRARRDWLVMMGYEEWEHSPPFQFGDVELSCIYITQERARPFVAVPEQMHPQQNVAGLWWRPLGDPADGARRRLN